MLEQYIPVLLLIALAVVLALAFIILSRLLGPTRPSDNKLGAYESGMDPIGQARDRYSVSFYIIAMEFIVFDLEVIFIYPWAVRYQEFGPGTFWAMMLFIFILFLGLIYTLKKGSFDWDTDPSIARKPG
ncbi:NADH-quinone oxidoreductase subunit A [Natronogracilivirga saccharolytica]|uniref:NADH-quinone oxidoreductase subunit A n=1 Tax=Natronogracilivirga saccharolytica TaxID=2812953 RepID=A0A8J7UVD3_9BACT|nr:NADH-quinone oxidoreductase subunit A [Natronogracilivirga saccharolytica]MBP3192437.1 NADH-quinone oxidoreductase subunit A [Natronogracilivirga saccharolytica]